jgi:hypothetical protein
MSPACIHSTALQVYTYLLRPLTAPGRTHSTAQQRQQQQQQHDSSTVSSSDPEHQQFVSGGRQGSGASEATVGYELQLVMEYCPLVSIRYIGC